MKMEEGNLDLNVCVTRHIKDSNSDKEFISAILLLVHLMMNALEEGNIYQQSPIYRSRKHMTFILLVPTQKDTMLDYFRRVSIHN